MSLLWTSEALVAAMSGRPVGSMPQGVTGISIDTRTLQPGEAFFAIKGDRFDGHDFATAAIKAGAALLVVAESKLPALGRLGTPMIVVPDVMAALEMAGVAARARSKARVIAVTGSAGKTTTKEMLRTALSAVGRVHASDKSFNNHWGVPLTLSRLPADADYAVFEVGMNHAGEISQLIRQVRPHIAIVTMIAAAHLGNFKSLDDIAHAKAEIFEGVVKGGHALINRDDQRWKLLDKAARDAGIVNVWGFGQHARATFRLVRSELGPEYSDIVARLAGEEIELRLGAPGRHMVQNALAVLGAAYLAGADMKKASAALSAVKAEKGRGQRHVLGHPGGTITLIDESYNANPASMRAALEMLAGVAPEGDGRRIAVLGDMLELGTHAQKLHAGLSEAVEAAGVDLALLAGPEMLALKAKLEGKIAVEHFESAAALGDRLSGDVRAGDVIMVKSSNGMGFSKVVDGLLQAYPAAKADGPAAAAE